jgi:hypothetical protein
MLSGGGPGARAGAGRPRARERPCPADSLYYIFVRSIRGHLSCQARERRGSGRVVPRRHTTPVTMATFETENPLGGSHLVQTLSGNGMLDPKKIKRRVASNTQVLYHVTTAAGGRAIAQTGMMLRGNNACMFGSGIYFAETPQAAEGKAWHGTAGDRAVITAEVDLGRCFEPRAADNTLAFRKLQKMGFDSTWAKARPHGPMKHADEWIVYNVDQVRPLSIMVNGVEILNLGSAGAAATPAPAPAPPSTAVPIATRSKCCRTQCLKYVATIICSLLVLAAIVLGILYAVGATSEGEPSGSKMCNTVTCTDNNTKLIANAATVPAGSSNSSANVTCCVATCGPTPTCNSDTHTAKPATSYASEGCCSSKMCNIVTCTDSNTKLIANAATVPAGSSNTAKTTCCAATCGPTPTCNSDTHTAKPATSYASEGCCSPKMCNTVTCTDSNTKLIANAATVPAGSSNTAKTTCCAATCGPTPTCPSHGFTAKPATSYASEGCCSRTWLDGFTDDGNPSHMWWRRFYQTHPFSYILLPTKWSWGGKPTNLQWDYSFIPYTSDSSHGYWANLGGCFTEFSNRGILWPKSCTSLFTGDAMTYFPWWKVMSSGWAFDALPNFCWGGGWGVANPLLFIAWIFVLICLILLELICLIFALVLMIVNVGGILIIAVLCWCWKAVLFLLSLLWHLLWGLVILLMWILGAVLWIVELVVMICIAVMLYPTYALPDTWQWVPWMLLMCCCCTCFRDDIKDWCD